MWRPACDILILSNIFVHQIIGKINVYDYCISRSVYSDYPCSIYCCAIVLGVLRLYNFRLKILLKMKRFNHMYLICSTLLTFGLLLKFREVNTIFITCIYIYCSASDGLVNATIFQEFLATSDKSEGVTTYNACMTAYTESLAKDKEDGRSIWIDKSGVEVRGGRPEDIYSPLSSSSSVLF